MTTVDSPRNNSRVVLRHGARGSGLPRPLSLGLGLVFAGIAVGVIDLGIDSFFLARAVWLNNAEPGMYATQTTMFLPYIGMAVRGIAYVILIVETVRVTRLVRFGGAEAEHARQRLTVIMAVCALGTILNLVISISMFWIASYPITGLRDGTVGEMLARFFSGDVTDLAYYGALSLLLDLVLLGMAVAVTAALGTRAAREHAASK